MKISIWLVIYVFILILICTSIANANMYLIKDQDGNVVSMTNKDCLSYAQIEKGYTITLMIQSSSTSSNNTPSTKDNISNETSTINQTSNFQSIPLENKKKADIKVIDWTSRMSDTGKYLYVEGILKNVGFGPAFSVEVLLKTLDEKGKLISIEKTYANPSTILPKQEVTFKFMIKNYKNIKDFNFNTSWKEDQSDIEINAVSNQDIVMLEIIDWNNRPSEAGNYIYVEGYVKNNSKRNVKGAKVNVKSLDADGKLISLDDSYLEPTVIAPNKEGVFKAMVKNNYKIKKFSLSVITESNVLLEVKGRREKPLAKQIININTASLEELMYILEINKHTATRVINRRSDMNGFKNPKDIMSLIEIGQIEWGEWIERGIVIIV